MSTRRPLNLIWRGRSLDAVLEGYFIKEVLLAEIDRPVRQIALDENMALPMLDDMLIASLGVEAARYVADARARGCRNIGLLHLGDERGNDDRSFYAHADYVIRHYWFEHVSARPCASSLGVIWVPNGYRTGVGPISTATLPGIAERQVIGFFAGMLAGRWATERDEMVRAVREANLPFVVISTASFGQGLGPVAYASWLANARFALVPAGNSPETIRLYDALEAGAIPIMVRSAFVAARAALDNPPFILLDSWRQLPEIYGSYADAMSPRVIEMLEVKRREIGEWWANFKRAQQLKVRDLIERSFARTPL